MLGKFGSRPAAADPPDPPSRGTTAAAGFAGPATAATPPSVGSSLAAGFGDATATSPVPAASAALHLHTFPAPSSPRTAPAAAVYAAPSLEPPQVLSWPTPAYTAAALQHHIQGEVVLQVRLGGDGTLAVLRVVHGLGYGLDRAAMAAARHLHFRPARNHGQPVDWLVLLHVRFRLAN
ncbi:MAG: energy transducer TonB [Terriglobales bacterium]